jgi:hypothetical protein
MWIKIILSTCTNIWVKLCCNLIMSNYETQTCDIYKHLFIKFPNSSCYTVHVPQLSLSMKIKCSIFFLRPGLLVKSLLIMAINICEREHVWLVQTVYAWTSMWFVSYEFKFFFETSSTWAQQSLSLQVQPFYTHLDSHSVINLDSYTWKAVLK